MLSILFLGMGAFFIGLGIYRLRGPISVWFLAISPYGAGNAYALIPLGIGFLFWALALSPFVSNNVGTCIFIMGGVVALAGMFVLPKFLKPPWLRWLEREHGKIIPFLRNEIQELGYQTWDRQINTQQDLEAWINTVKRKRGWL